MFRRRSASTLSFQGNCANVSRRSDQVAVLILHPHLNNSFTLLRLRFNP
ncbi:MAG: hypothetical protein H7A37_06735 [Chlamydiales bacterium]|nr:hypothetical protein [Chlamydiales bacterium]